MTTSENTTYVQGLEEQLDDAEREVFALRTALRMLEMIASEANADRKEQLIDRALEALGAD